MLTKRAPVVRPASAPRQYATGEAVTVYFPACYVEGVWCRAETLPGRVSGDQPDAREWIRVLVDDARHVVPAWCVKPATTGEVTT